MNKSNYLNLVGLAYRARKCSTGIDIIIEDIRNSQARLVLIASDTSEATKKKLIDKCTSYNIPYIEVAEREALGRAIGKAERVAIAILDAGFANKLKTLLL